MRVAVIGALGSIGRRHCQNLEALGCRIARVDAAFSGEEGYTLSDIAVWNPDAVVIATPWDTHLQYVEWAIANRLPFFVEKPLGSLEQLPRWREIAAMELPRHMVGYNWRFNPEVLAWRERWRGRAVSMSLTCHTNMATWPGRCYGDPLLECSHEWDLAAWLYESGMEHRIRTDVCWAVQRAWRRYEVADEDGTVFAVEPTQESLDQSYVDEMRAFITGGVGCTLREALNVLETLAEAKASV